MKKQIDINNSSTILDKVLSVYIYGHIHVALAAVAFTTFAYWGSDSQIEWNYLLFVFSASMLLYSMHRIIGNKKTKDFEYFNRISLNTSHRKTFLVVAIIGGLASLYFYWKINDTAKYCTILPSIISLGYTLPVIYGKRLRDLPFVKVFLIAFSWSIICTYIPLLHSNLTSLQRAIWTIATAFYVFGIAIPFDIRDFEIDKIQGTITLPTKFGLITSTKISQMGLLISALIYMYLARDMNLSKTMSYAMIGSVILSLPLISKTDPNSPRFYISGIIEGLLMLPLILYFLLENLFSLI